MGHRHVCSGVEIHLLEDGRYRCNYCGSAFKRNRRPAGDEGKRFCSRDCSFAFIAEHSKPRACAVYVRNCRICGVLFVSRGKGAHLCGDECRKENTRRQSRAHSIRESGRDRKPRACKECGMTFVPEYGNKHRLFCSYRCLRKMVRRSCPGKHRERVRKYGGRYLPVRPRAIFERDQWTCQICGKKTPEHLRGSCNSAAPELDHIMPVSRGGDHVPLNLQCACRACNCTKGAG